MKTGAEKVIVEKVFTEKSDGSAYKEGFQGVQLRVNHREKSLTTIMLGGEGFEKTKVAFQTVTSALGLKEGDDLGAKLGQAVRLRIVEAFSPEWKHENGTKYRLQEKINPESGEILTSNGQVIYRNVLLDLADSKDITIAHDRAETAVEENDPANAA